MADAEGSKPGGSAPSGPAGKRHWEVAGVVAGALALTMAGRAQAGEWELTPRLRVVETYTDNVTLAPSGDEESEFVTQINPGVSLRGRGRRARLNLDYQMQNLFYAKESGRNTTNHQLGADGTLELVRRSLFLEAQASRTQQLISPEDAISANNLTVTGNRRDVTTYSAGPRVQHAFGNFATGRARYRWRRVDYESGLDDRTQQTATASLASGRRFDVVGWGLNYRHTRETGADIPDQTLEIASANLSLLLGAKTRIFGVGGYENNEYEQAAGDDPPDGEFWEAGLRFNPSRHTSLEAAYGERFFGETKRFEFRHQGPSTSWEASYSENLITYTQVQELQTDRLIQQILQDGFDDLTDQEFAQLVALANAGETVSLVRNQVILQRRANGSVTWASGGSRIGIRGFWERREFQTSGQEEELYGGSSRIGWKLGPRTRARVGGSWQRRLFPLTGREDDLWFGELAANRRVGVNARLEFSYRHLRRESNAANRSYRENEVELALEKRF